MHFQNARVFSKIKSVKFTAELCMAQSHDWAPEEQPHKVPNAGMIPYDPPNQTNPPSANNGSHTLLMNTNNVHFKSGVIKTQYHLVISFALLYASYVTITYTQQFQWRNFWCCWSMYVEWFTIIPVTGHWKHFCLEVKWQQHTVTACTSEVFSRHKLTTY